MRITGHDTEGVRAAWADSGCGTVRALCFKRCETQRHQGLFIYVFTYGPEFAGRAVGFSPNFFSKIHCLVSPNHCI